MNNFDIIVWAVVMALAFVGEILTVSFFLVFFALGAAVALVISLVADNVALEVVGFIVASLASMAILRPALVNRLSLRNGEGYRQRKSITGRNAVVTETIEPDESGMVRVGNGEFWTARALYSGRRIEAGSKVRVLDTDGLTALVEPIENEGGE